MIATLTIGDDDWLLPSLIIAAGGIVWLAWCYRNPWADRSRLPGFVLKVLALAATAACLVDPLWSGLRAKPGSNLLTLIVDTSQSMRLRESEHTEPRDERIAALVSSDNFRNEEQQLARDFHLRRYTLSSHLKPVPDFSELEFRGASSNLQAALTSLREQLAGHAWAGTLLFSDGLATDADTASLELNGLPPVFPVWIGRDVSLPDLAVDSVTISSTAFEDAPVTVTADVRADRCAGESITAQLLDETGKVVASERFPVNSEHACRQCQFRFRPESRDLQLYQVRLTASSGRTEAATGNDTRCVMLEDRHARPRVLYVSGRPNWEFKFLRRSLEDDEHLELTGLIRIARKEGRFEFRNQTNLDSNPLYRGFREADIEEQAHFDEAVFLRINARGPEELRHGFPQSAEELFEYSAVIIDDLEAAFFTPKQQELVRRFVAERGGALLMLGGQEAFADGAYGRTPIGNLLPVLLTDRTQIAPGPVRWELTRDGWLQPWMRLHASQEAEHQRLTQMPGFRVVNAAQHLKPGARALAMAVDGSGTSRPAFAVQQFGRGRTAAMMIGDLWRWQMRGAQDSTMAARPLGDGQPESSGGSDDCGRAWRQLIRWLISDVPGPLAVQHDFIPGTDVVTLTAEVKSPAYQPRDDVRLQWTVMRPDGSVLQTRASSSLERPGHFDTRLTVRQPGPYRAELQVQDLEGETVETLRYGWVHEPARREFGNDSDGRALLEQLAARTGGRVLTPVELEHFSESFVFQDVPVQERWTSPIWHRSWVLAFVVICLIGEWTLRRFRGMA